MAQPAVPGNDARQERAAEAEQAIRFRSLRERTIDDQRQAIIDGYDSVEQLAIDELGRAYHELLGRVERLEETLGNGLAGRVDKLDEIVKCLEGIIGA